RTAASLRLDQIFFSFLALSGRSFHPLLRKWPSNRSVTLFWGEHRGRRRNLSVPLAAPNFSLMLSRAGADGGRWNAPAERRLGPVPPHEGVLAHSNDSPHFVDRGRAGAVRDGVRSHCEEGLAAAPECGGSAPCTDRRNRWDPGAGKLAHSFARSEERDGHPG